MVCHHREPCTKRWTDRDVVWVVDKDGPKEPCIRRKSRSTRAKGKFWGRIGRPIAKYTDILPWAVQKRLNRSDRFAQLTAEWTDWDIVWDMDSDGPMKHVLDGVHIGATWWTRLNRPCAAAMRPHIKLRSYSCVESSSHIKAQEKYSRNTRQHALIFPPA